MIDKKQKQKIVSEFGKNESDTGSVGVQIALITGRIKYLTEHLKINKKDRSQFKKRLVKVSRAKAKFIAVLPEKRFRSLQDVDI